MEIKIVVLDDVCTPQQGTPGSAGYDLVSSQDWDLYPRKRHVVPAGIKVAIPDGYAGLVTPRSGLAAKNGITVLNAPGLIDPSYRGEIGVVLYNTGEDVLHITKGTRIAQLLIVPFVYSQWNIVSELDETERGENGFGSTGTL